MTPTPELNKALAAFQADLPKIPKNAKGEIRGVTKEGKPYSYQFDYASLEDVTDETLPALGRQGLSLTGAITTDGQGRIVYEYTLLHESGEERGPWQFPLWLLLPDRFTAQTIGGYITYARRYIIGPATGIAPGGQDIDTTGADEVSKPAADGRWMNRPLDVPPKDLPRTRTRTTGAEHEQLRAGTVEPAPGDKRTQHLRVAEPDPWTDQPAGQFDAATVEPENKPGSADTRQTNKIARLFHRLGIDDHDKQLAITENVIGGPLDGPEVARDGTHRTRKNLSYQEAEKVIKDLEGRIEAAAAVPSG